jgi:putative glycerol-1-phosphate prenyltransferase
MSERKILSGLRTARKNSIKKFAILLDPDEPNLRHLEQTLALADQNLVDYILIGGSLLTDDRLTECIIQAKEQTDIPVILFPGNNMQISKEADAILFLSLISGRNPEYLIGQQVKAAPIVKRARLEVISTAYLLIDGGATTSAQYMSNSMPIPNNKPEIVACTALAGEMLGFNCIYLDAGSGAEISISNNIIHKVRREISLPLIVGGGIRQSETAYDMARAGADVVVVGNAIEKDPSLMLEMASAVKDAEISI